MLFKGSAVAIVTPFTEDGKVNFNKFGELLEFQIANGTDAVVVCGTTGVGYSLFSGLSTNTTPGAEFKLLTKSLNSKLFSNSYSLQEEQ